MKTSKPVILLVLLVGVVAVVVSALVFGANQLLQPKVPVPGTFRQQPRATPPQSSDQFAKGVKRLAQYYKDYPGLVQKSAVQVQLQGEISSIGQDSVTIKRGSQELLIRHEDTTHQTAYMETTRARTPPQRTTKDALRVGDTVDVLLEINPYSAEVSINAIVRIQP